MIVVIKEVVFSEPFDVLHVSDKRT